MALVKFSIKQRRSLSLFPPIRVDESIRHFFPSCRFWAELTIALYIMRIAEFLQLCASFFLGGGGIFECCPLETNTQTSSDLSSIDNKLHHHSISFTPPKLRDQWKLCNQREESKEEKRGTAGGWRQFCGGRRRGPDWRGSDQVDVMTLRSASFIACVELGDVATHHRERETLIKLLLHKR